MTLFYNNIDEVAMMCDVCEKKTAFYATLPLLLQAVNFNKPLTDDNAGWCYGPGKKVIAGGFQPVYTVDSTKHCCFTCRGFFETLSFTASIPGVSPGARYGKIGQPDQQVRREDQRLNKTDLFDGTVSKYPRSFPRSEPDFSHDVNYNPLEDG